MAIHLSIKMNASVNAHLILKLSYHLNVTLKPHFDKMSNAGMMLKSELLPVLHFVVVECAGTFTLPKYIKPHTQQATCEVDHHRERLKTS